MSVRGLWRADRLTLSRILYLSSSGLGRLSVSALPSSGTSRNLCPRISFIVLTRTSCCLTSQWISAEMMTGYGDATNAYLPIAWTTSRTVTLPVNVRPW